jgi:hypothetical protein
LIEIKPDTPPADIPQLDQLFAQAVSEDLRKKLLSHLQALPTTTNNENVQRFSDLVQHAIEAENELTTITNIASRAAHRESKPHAGRQQTQQNRGPRTFFNAGEQEPNDECSKNSVHASSNTCCIATNCDSILHSTGPAVIPTCFLAKHLPQISPEQEELMALATVAMGTAVDSMLEDMPFTGTSIAEEALQQASGTRIPTKCFGCDGPP